MKTAISSSCFYPMPTENTIEKIAALGFSSAEIFINTIGEASREFLKDIKKRADYYGVTIESVHTPLGFAEPNYFFSSYVKRTEESFLLYERIFDAVSAIEPSVFNFHGDFLAYNNPIEKDIEVYAKLYEMAKNNGFLFCQENVNKYVMSKPENIAALRTAIPHCAFTLDIKQANRSGYSPFEIAKAMGKNIKNFHVNDFNTENDCLLPGEGNFELDRFIEKIKSYGYNERAIIEVYNHNYKSDEQIKAAKKILDNILKVV